MRCPDCGKENLSGFSECESCHTSLSQAAAHSPKRGMEKRILEGKIAALSPKSALQIGPQEGVQAALVLMRSEKAGCLLVIEGDRLLGELSEWEILLASDKTDFARLKVRDLMRPAPAPLSDGDDAAYAFNQFALSGHHHMPVRMKDGSYGVISARDLLRYLCK